MSLEYEKDLKDKSYNPLIFSYGSELTEENRYALRCAAILELDAMSKAVELMDFTEHRDVEGILKNIMYLGMVAETDRVLKFTSC